MFLTVILAALALVSLGTTLWQWAVARRFPLHRRVTDKSFAPAVTLLKPLKGCDAETAACLRSWFTQDYAGPAQILFGVATADDPVCAVVKELLAAHPQADAQLIICGESLGANAKVSTLIQLQRAAKHDFILISDADVRVPADFLPNAVAPLRDEGVGAAFCFYQLANPSNLAMRWEAVVVNGDFWSLVLMGRSLKPLDFVLGAVMITRRKQLEEIGGFPALADHLADDYQLGNQIVRRGHRIAICPVVVECWDKPMTWGEVWAHQLRWARTIRVCQPGPYFGSIISNATLWPLLALAARPTKLMLAAVCLCLALRMGVALDLQRRLTQARTHFFHDWLVLVKDLLQVALWALSFLGSEVVWRGRRYRVRPGGKLELLAGGNSRP